VVWKADEAYQKHPTAGRWSGKLTRFVDTRTFVQGAIHERALLNLLSRFKQASQQYGLPIPKLQCIMMYSLVLLVGLPGNGRHMSEGHFHQANNPGWLHLTALHPSAVTRRT
jgi:hypothetical protein